MKTKICLICKKEFIQNNNSQKYCSLKCNNKIKCQKYRQKHKKELREKDHKKYLLNKEKIKNRVKKYYYKHKEICAKRMKKWYQQNKEKINLQQIIRRKQDINYKITSYLRIRISRVLKGIIKSKSTTKLVGCNIEQLKKYLEKHFQPGMSWNNYGYCGWHIDHIRPCCSFDLSKASEQKKCFHYTNLQPLWAIDNLRKGAKYDRDN